MKASLVRVLRWLFAVLILFNIALLMWASWYRVSPPEEGRMPLPPVNADRMVPLTSPGLSLHPRLVTNKALPPAIGAAAPAPPTEKSRACVSIGPFDTGELAEQAGKRLVESKLAYMQRVDADRIESSYWIYLPPLANRKAADTKREELARLGINDHYIMQEPGLENIISLGLFSQIDNARHRMDELAAKGIYAKQETRYRTRTLYWLDIPTDQVDDLISQLKKMNWTDTELHTRASACGVSPALPAAGEPAAGKAE